MASKLLASIAGLAAALLLVLPPPGLAQGATKGAAVYSGGATLWDSTIVASGATATSPLINLTGYREIELFVDNTSGTGFRDVTMTSLEPLAVSTLDPVGAVTVDSVLVRRVAWGTKPTGGLFDPGRVRGYIGPNPPAPQSGPYLLFDSTAAASTAIDQTLVIEGTTSLTAYYSGVGNGASSTLQEVDDAGTSILQQSHNHVADSTAWYVWGLQSGTRSYQNGVGNPFYAADSPPRRVRVTAGAISGAAPRVRVTTTGQMPGTFVVQMALPAMARFAISSATGTVHAWVVGR